MNIGRVKCGASCLGAICLWGEFSVIPERRMERMEGGF